jgi:hypothetical protein
VIVEIKESLEIPNFMRERHDIVVALQGGKGSTLQQHTPRNAGTGRYAFSHDVNTRAKGIRKTGRNQKTASSVQHGPAIYQYPRTPSYPSTKQLRPATKQ